MHTRELNPLGAQGVEMEDKKADWNLPANIRAGDGGACALPGNPDAHPRTLVVCMQSKCTIERQLYVGVCCSSLQFDPADQWH